MEAVLFVGIPGSGKTTFYLQRFFPTHVHVSKDLLRTRHREQVFLRACLETQQRFVVDNTNVLAAERALYIPQAKAARFKVVGYYFETDVKDALARNARREGRAVVPIAGVLSKQKRMQRPEYSEGFDELYAVTLNPAGLFVVLPYS